MTAAAKVVQSDIVLDTEKFNENWYYRGAHHLAIIDAFIIKGDTLHLVQVTLAHRKEFRRLEDVGQSPGLEGLVAKIVKKAATSAAIKKVAFHYVEHEAGKLGVRLAGPEKVSIQGPPTNENPSGETSTMLPAVTELPDRVGDLELSVDIVTINPGILYRSKEPDA